jgi:hypothetical protein
MSDHHLIVVPLDPRAVPSADEQGRVTAALEAIAPRADSVNFITSSAVQFVDCGGNFESVSCPACGADTPLEWWQERMDEDFVDGGFLLHRYNLPCCSSSLALNELVYDSPQAFGRSKWEVLNPGIAEITDAELETLTLAAARALQVVWQRF